MPREQKSNQIGVSFLMTKQEHEIISAKAKELGMSLAGYFKFLALNYDIKINQK
jgi:hypothetical protein